MTARSVPAFTWSGVRIRRYLRIRTQRCVYAGTRRMSCSPCPTAGAIFRPWSSLPTTVPPEPAAVRGHVGMFGACAMILIFRCYDRTFETVILMLIAVRYL